ncbi:MAG: B3/4 domain-containing protein [Alphaproteobacteria bacterium]
MVRLDISEIVGSFPACRIGLVVATGLEVAHGRPPALDAAVGEVEAGVLARYDAIQLGEIRELAEWREAYKGFGIRKTSYRPSVERLIKNIKQGRGLPRVNALVDAYNAVSAMHLMPVGADDLDKVAGDLAFRFSRPTDTFIRLGNDLAAVEPPKPGEVVYADGEKVLCRRWNWYQDARSPVTEASRRAVLTIQALATGDIEGAVADLCRWVSDHCAAETCSAIARADAPVAEVATLPAE